MQQKCCNASKGGAKPANRRYSVSSSGVSVNEKPTRRYTISSYREIEKPLVEDQNKSNKKTPVKKISRHFDSPTSVIDTLPSSTITALRNRVFYAPYMSPPSSPTTSKKLKTTIPKKVSKLSAAVKPKKSAPSTASYSRWDFGKTKHFERPRSTPRTNKAAIAIQRIARGGMRRLHYKVARLEWMLSTGIRERAKADVDKVHQELKQRKAQFRTEMEAEAKKESLQLQKAMTTTEEAHKLIAYLRKENKKVRESNQELFGKIIDMKEQNERIEGANEETEKNMNLLKEHFKTLEETNAKLMEVIPMYEESIEELTEAIEIRNQFAATEHEIKLLYVKLMGDIVGRVEESHFEEALAEEVVQSVLELEEQELAKGRLPNFAKLPSLY